MDYSIFLSIGHRSCHNNQQAIWAINIETGSHESLFLYCI